MLCQFDPCLNVIAPLVYILSSFLCFKLVFNILGPVRLECHLCYKLMSASNYHVHMRIYHRTHPDTKPLEPSNRPQKNEVKILKVKENTGGSSKTQLGNHNWFFCHQFLNSFYSFAREKGFLSAAEGGADLGITLLLSHGIVATSVTRRLDKFLNIWPFATIKICPISLEICQSMFTILANIN